MYGDIGEIKMKDFIVEAADSILELADVFNNPIGYASVAVAVVAGILLCKFAKPKALFICACACLACAMLGLGLATLSPAVECLWLPLFFFPFFAVTFLFWLLKLIVEHIRNRARDNA